MKFRKIMAIMLCAIMFGGALVGCSSKNDDKTLVILDGQFTEIDILQQMAKILVEENTDLKVKMHDSMTTVTAAKALQSKEVDLYVGYDGTMIATILGKDVKDVPEGQTVFEYAQKEGSKSKGLTLLDKFGFENTYALAIREDFAQEKNIQTISDLIPYAPEMVFGAEHEFFDEEGTVRYKPFNNFYDIKWKEDKSLDIGFKYSAMDNKNIDATIIYSTNGLNKKSNLRVLKDDRHFFPEYFASFEMRDSLFEEFKETAPNLKEVLSKLNGVIDNNTMLDLNYRVDALGEKPDVVAKEFLKEKGLTK